MIQQSITTYLNQLEAEGRLRTIPDEKDPDLVDFLSNDYIGLGKRSAEFKDEFCRRYPDVDMTSSASRLLSRNHKYHAALEKQLSQLFGKEALLFNSGYHANTGAVCALATLLRTLFVCDKSIHASIVDGLMIGKAEFKRFKHNDIKSLEDILKKESANYDNIIVVIEAIYSMSGDLAPLQQIVNLKKEYPNLTVYLDEAHSFGVLNNDGRGLAASLNLLNDIDIIVVTFGKALASSGAAVITTDTIKSLLINAGRSFIFSTAIPPIVCAWTSLMIEKMTGMENERRYVMESANQLRAAIERITHKKSMSESPVVPLTTGSAQSAIELADKLRSKGFDVLPIRRPTVAPNNEGIRFSLSASVTPQQLHELIECLQSFQL